MYSYFFPKLFNSPARVRQADPFAFSHFDLQGAPGVIIQFPRYSHQTFQCETFIICVAYINNRPTSRLGSHSYRYLLFIQDGYDADSKYCISLFQIRIGTTRVEKHVSASLNQFEVLIAQNNNSFATEPDGFRV